MPKIVARWDYCGQRELEQDIEFITDDGIAGISADFAMELIMENNTLVEETGFGKHVTLEEQLWPTREYFVCYMLHPDSGYRIRDINVREEDGGQVFTADVERLKGGHFCANWSEVVIFRLD